MKKLPRLCIHKGTGQYYVRIQGHHVYLGKVGGPEEEAAAETARLRVLGECRATGQLPGKMPTGGPTVDVVAAAYMEHVKEHYRKRDGKPTSQQGVIVLALRALLSRYGTTPASEFGPLALRAVRKTMIDGSWMTDADREAAGSQRPSAARPESGRGWARKTINAMVGNIRAMFKWAVSQEMVHVSVWQALTSVPPLLEGRSKARETGEVPPAPRESVDAVMSAAGRHVADMMRLQLLTGARPGEVCAMRPMDLDRTGALLSRLAGEAVAMAGCWAYLPGLEDAGAVGNVEQDHKTAHKGHGRVIPIGPAAQAILAPYLEGRAMEAYVFSPAEAQQERHQKQRALCAKPRPMARVVRRRKKNPQWAPGERYTTTVYSNAVRRTMLKVNRERVKKGLPPLPYFHCHQLRHSSATELERQFGREVARLILGHGSATMTARYIAPNLAAALAAAGKVG